MRKSIYKIITLIMCVSVLMTVFSPVAYAAKETIWEIFVEYYAPVEGKTISTYPHCFTKGCDTDLYYNYDNFIESVRAYDLTEKGYLDADDLVIAGHQYKIDILVKPDNGYHFVDYNGTPNVAATIRSHGVDTREITPQVSWYDSKSILLSYVYVVSERDVIDQVTISVTPPKDGEYPDFESIIYSPNVNMNYNYDDGEYVINGIQWGVAPAESVPTALAQPLHKDAAFRGGVTYRLAIDVIAIQDYAGGIERVFDFECSSYVRNYDVTVNGGGSYTKYIPYSSDDKFESLNSLRIFCDFYCPYKYNVSEVSIEADPPMIEGKPDFDVAMGANDYKLVDYNDEGFIGGIKWHNNTTGCNLTEDDEFVQGNSYSLVTYLEPANDETIFTKNYWGDTTVTATVNGNEAYTANAIMVNQNASYAIEVEYRFDTISNTLARVAVLDIEKPLARQTPDYDAIVKNMRFYNFNNAQDDGTTVINGISWHNNTEGVYMESTDTFEAGNDYTVCIDLLINDDYAVDGTTTFAVNDAEATQSMIVLGTKKVRITYNFGEIEPLKTEYNAATEISTPVEGEYPDFTPVLENDECRVNSVKWYDVSAMQAIELSGRDKFVGGHTYKVELNLLPAESYEFATDESGNLRYEFDFVFERYVYNATKVEGDKNEVMVSYTFFTIPIEKIDVEFDAPIPGFEPAYIAYASNNSCNTSYVTWYDKTDDVYFDAYGGNVFEEDHIYVATVDVFTVGTATFNVYADNFTASVNGNPVEAGTVYYKVENAETIEIYSTLYAIRLTYEFAPCKYEDEFSITCDRLTGLVEVYYGIYSPFEENELAVYIAFYGEDGKLMSVIPKDVVWASDMYGEQAPEGATYCKAMIWYKDTFMPFCDAVGCDIVLDPML